MSTFSAAKLDLSEPDKFQMASVVTKNSRLGISSNKRLLVIKKGYLYYYSNVPKKFKGDSSIVQTIHQLPKCSIEIVNIKNIKGYESNSSYFSIEFDSKNMLERQDIRKTMTLEQYNFSPKNSKQNIVWQFTCDNQFIKQRWVAALEGLQAYYVKEKKDIEKFFNEHKDNNSQMKSSSSGGRNSHVPWRQSQGGNNGNKKNNDVNYLQLVATKSDDRSNDRSNDRSVTPDNKNLKPMYLNVQNANNSPSRTRGNSANEEQKKSEFMKQYSPNQPLHKLNDSKPLILPSSEQQIETPKTTSKQIIQNSPIDRLQLSDIKNSPAKQNSNMNFSKTQKIKVSEQTIQQQESQSNKSPGPSPVKQISLDSSGYDANDNEAQQFQQDLERMEKTNFIKNQPQQQFNLQNKLIENSSLKGKGLFHELNSQQDKSPLKQKNNKILISQININLDDDIKPLKNQQNQRSVIKPQKVPLAPIQFPSQPEQISFYNLHRYIFLNSFSFTQRIQLQQHFHTRIHKFSSQCTTYLTQYIESLSQPSSNLNFEILYKTNNYTLLRHVYSKYLMKLAVVTSQSLQINGQQKIYFDEQCIKNLKRQFKVYNDLQKMLLINLKNNQNIRIRIPLICLIQYKGIVALFIDQQYLQSNINIRNSNIFNNHQIKKIYNKQIDILNNQNYNIKDFIFIESNKDNYLIINLLPEIVSNRLCKQQTKKNYLKKLLGIKRQQKHHNLQLNQPFTQQLIVKAHQTNASTSIQSLEQYINTLYRIQQFQGICPKQQIIDIMKICVFCKQIRKIYRSAQGEIQQTHFLNLILKQDPQIMKILNQSGCDEIPKIKGVLFTFINHYMGIKCTINQQISKDLPGQNYLNVKNNKKKFDIVQSTQIRAKVQSYDISKLELIEAYQSMRKFISEQKTHLALETLKLLQNLHLQQFSQLNDKRLQMIYFQASLAYLQHDYLKCIENCKQYQKLLNNLLNPKLIEIYLLMLKSYSHFSDQQFKITFDKIIKLVQFNYGTNNSIFISVYSISSFFFYEMAQKSQPDTKISNPLFMLSYKLLDQAQKLCLKHFGQTSNQYIDILMDSARLYEVKDRIKSQKYLDRARTIIISTQNNNKLMQYFIYELKLALNLKQYQKCMNLLNQCQQLIYLGKLKIDSKKNIELMRVKFELGYMVNDKIYLAEHAIQELWRSDRIQEKRQGIILVGRLMNKLNIIQQVQQQYGYVQNRYQINQQQMSLGNNDINYIGVQQKQVVINKILQILAQSEYPRMNIQQNDTLIQRIKQMIQQQNLQKQYLTRNNLLNKNKNNKKQSLNKLFYIINK